jgi:hypothetical protein
MKVVLSDRAIESLQDARVGVRRAFENNCGNNIGDRLRGKQSGASL